MSGLESPDRVGVCSLPPAEREERVVWLRREVLPRARRMQRLDDGRAWEFAPDSALRRTLEQLVAFEQGCCGSLRWSVDAEPDVLRLRIQGLDPDSPFFEAPSGDAGDASGPDAGTGDEGARRALRAGGGGLAAGAAALIACELPWVLALVGVGAAPFLDAFAALALVGGAGLVGFALWRRRRAAPA